ncbi:MAG: TIGR03668 family PPOX class F420-dependent oxidoreductase [Pseudomonadota bacterium]
MLTDDQRRFLEAGRVGRLATTDGEGQPHVVPICYALLGDVVCFTIDEKPKKTMEELKRLRNIRANPKVALVVDYYDEDWSKLGWVMIQGEADIVKDGPMHRGGQARLRERYPPVRSMQIESLPLVAITATKVLSWGRLDRLSGRQREDSGQS